MCASISEIRSDPVNSLRKTESRRMAYGKVEHKSHQLAMHERDTYLFATCVLLFERYGGRKARGTEEKM